MDANAKQLCRVCLQNSEDSVSVFDEFDDAKIASILVEHFWFQVHKNDGMTEWLCQMCWTQIKAFHIFYNRIEFLHASYNLSVETISADTIKKEQSDSLGEEASELQLNIVECEETKLTEVVDIYVGKEDKSVCDDANDCDEAIDCDGSENLQTSDDEQQSSNKEAKNDDVEDINITDKQTPTAEIKLKRYKMHTRSSNKKAKHDDVGDINVTDKQTLTAKTKPRRYNMHSRSELDKLDARIREVFSMKCEICTDVEFETLLMVEDHYRQVHKTDGYLVCCGKKFHHPDMILTHIRRHDRLDKQNAQIREYFSMKCEICTDVEFETFLGATQHYRKVHKTTGYLVCCKRKYTRPCQILNHIRYHVNPDAYRCDQCGRCFENERAMKGHIDNHAPRDSRAQTCSLCSKSYTTAAGLKAHVQYKHPSKTDETFSCEKCNKKFTSKSKLTYHIRKVHESTKLVCEICARQFKTKTTLQNHIEHQHSTTPKVQCNICNAWSKNKACLLRHIKLHGRNEDDQVNCPICKKVVKDKKLLRGHITIAHAERNHRCTLCDKAYKTAKILKEHIASHTGEDLYDCLFCEKKFKSNANMYSHRKKAHLAEWTQYMEKKKMEEK